MKKILLIICLFPILVFSQKSYKIPADSTILNNIGSGKNELVIRNATSNITGGVLTNLGNGVTAFVLGGDSARVVDTIYKNNTKDSIVFTISGIRYAVKDSFNLNTDSQTLSISNDTLTISGGNSVILPVYIQIDSSTINSYDVLNSQNTPPISPNTGDVYLVGTVPTGAWVGHAKDIAEWDGADWVFTDGVQGDFLYNATNALTYIFRSGNWVQTTGIPALNNGNTISSGLRIGTNNARSLTFETNNVNRGRFDSVGRFYVYDTSLRKANKYLQIDSITGRLVASEISGGGGASLSGLTAATASNTIDNASYPQTWNWTGITSSTFGIKLGVTSAAPLTTLGGALDIAVNATTENSTRTVYGIRSIMTGGNYGTTHIAGYFETGAGTGTKWASWHKGNVRIEGGTSAKITLDNTNQIYSDAGPLVLTTAASIRHHVPLGSYGYYLMGGNGSYLSYSISPLTTTRTALTFGGDAAYYYRSQYTTSANIEWNADLLQLGANSGNTGNFASYTPNFILNIKGSTSNVGIGTTTPVASAKLQISSTTSGFLPPVMTSTQASAISSPAQGLMLFVTDTNGTFTSVGWWGYNGATWEKLNN